MDRALYQLTVLAASGCIIMIALSAGFSSNSQSELLESYNQTPEISHNLTN